MGGFEQNVGLISGDLGAFKHLASHRTPVFMVPNEVDWLAAPIVNYTKDGEVLTEPGANIDAWQTRRRQAGTFSLRICAENRSRKRVFARCRTASRPVSMIRPSPSTMIRSACLSEASR